MLDTQIVSYWQIVLIVHNKQAEKCYLHHTFRWNAYVMTRFSEGNLTMPYFWHERSINWLGGINGDHFWSDLISASSHVSVEGKGELMDKLLYITYCVYLHRLTIKYNVSLFVIISVNINKLIISFLSSFIVL